MLIYIRYEKTLFNQIVINETVDITISINFEESIHFVYNNIV